MASSKKRKDGRSPGAPQRSSGERSETERSGGAPGDRGAAAPRAAQPDPEVLERPQRRKFPAEYKLRILAEADACVEQGQLGAFLRREGLYSSHISTWRRQRDEGALSGLTPKKRGRKVPKNPLAAHVATLEAEIRRLQKQLEEAATIIEFQKKVSDVLRIPLSRQESDGSGS